MTRSGMVSVAHQKGVDVLIVVGVPPYPYRQISENSDRETILTQLVRVLSNSGTLDSVRTLSQSDYVVRPDEVNVKSRLQNAPAEDLNSSDYIERGKAATLELTNIHSLSLNQQDYLSWRRKIDAVVR